MSLPVCQHRADDSIPEISRKNLRHLLSLKRPSKYIRGESRKSYGLKIVHSGRRFMCIISTTQIFRLVWCCRQLRPRSFRLTDIWVSFKDFLRLLRRGIGLSQGPCQHVTTWRYKEHSYKSMTQWNSISRSHCFGGKGRSWAEGLVCSRERILAKLAQDPLVGSIISLQNIMYLAAG